MSSLSQSFKFAFNGVLVLVRSQRNARIHLVLTILVVGLGLFFKVSGIEWAALVLAMGLVWSAEAMNTAVEVLADVLHPKKHPKIGLAKDLAAASVLVAALAALVTGLLIFLPYLFRK